MLGSFLVRCTKVTILTLGSPTLPGYLVTMAGGKEGCCVSSYRMHVQFYTKVNDRDRDGAAAASP